MQTTPDYKEQAAKAAFQLIEQHQVIGLGAGSCVALLAEIIAGNEELSATLVLTSSSFKTTNILLDRKLNVKPPHYFDSLDIYFDGCDQFDSSLNALKSGGGIHTTEKTLASMAKEFVLLGDSDKRVPELDGKYPLLVEIVAPALRIVSKTLTGLFPDADLNLRQGKDGAVVTEYGNYLLDVTFSKFPEPGQLNTVVKMIPGVVDHSLFYRIATKGITAGADGVQIFTH